MSVVHATYSGFVGFRGRNIELRAGEEWNLDDPFAVAFVSAHPEYFTGEDKPVKPVRRKASRG